MCFEMAWNGNSVSLRLPSWCAESSTLLWQWFAVTGGGAVWLLYCSLSKRSLWSMWGMMTSLYSWPSCTDVQSVPGGFLMIQSRASYTHVVTRSPTRTVRTQKNLEYYSQRKLFYRQVELGHERVVVGCQIKSPSLQRIRLRTSTNGVTRGSLACFEERKCYLAVYLVGLGRAKSGLNLSSPIRPLTWAGAGSDRNMGWYCTGWKRQADLIQAWWSRDRHKWKGITGDWSWYNCEMVLRN